MQQHVSGNIMLDLLGAESEIGGFSVSVKSVKSAYVQCTVVDGQSN